MSKVEGMEKEKVTIIHSLDELHLFSCMVFGEVNDTERDSAGIILLSGDLGAGKTAFVKELADCLHIKEEITSPTFVIQKEYSVRDSTSSFKKLIHIDAYRLERKEELEYLGWDDLICNPENLILIEWPEKVVGIEIPHALHIYFESTRGDERRVSILSNTQSV